MSAFFSTVLLLATIAGEPSPAKPTNSPVAAAQPSDAEHAADLARLRLLISRPKRPILHGMAPLDERQTRMANIALDHYKEVLVKLSDRADNPTIRRHLATFTADAIAKRNRDLRAVMPEIRRSTFDKFIAQEETGIPVAPGLYQSFYLDQTTDTQYSFTVTNRGTDTYHDATFYVTFVDGNGKEVRGGWSGAKVIAPNQTVAVSLPAPAGMVDFILEAGFKSVD